MSEDAAAEGMNDYYVSHPTALPKNYTTAVSGELRIRRGLV